MGANVDKRIFPSISAATFLLLTIIMVKQRTSHIQERIYDHVVIESTRNGVSEKQAQRTGVSGEKRCCIKAALGTLIRKLIYSLRICDR